MRINQREVDEREKDENNLLFYQHSQEELNNEKQYKERFIRSNKIQMRRNDELLKALK